MNESYYLEATPWKGCPFKLYLVVVTAGGKDDAIKTMQEFFNNSALEPETINTIAVVKGKMIAEEDNPNANPSTIKS